MGRIRDALSGGRLDRFSEYNGQPAWEVLANYAWNIALCEAVYPLLHHAEVTARNAIDGAIASAYPMTGKDVASWIDSAKTPLTQYAQKEVERAKKKLFGWDPKRNRLKAPSRPIVHGDLVAAMDFGFWAGLLHHDYIYQSGSDPRFWPQLLKPAFPHASGWDMKFRGVVSGEMNHIRMLRNRVFHHEPIWRRTLMDDRRRVLELISWSSPEAARFAEMLDRLPEVFSPDFRRRLRARVFLDTRK